MKYFTVVMTVLITCAIKPTFAEESCIRKKITLIKEEPSVRFCYIQEELNLGEDFFDYYNLNPSWRKVRYWRGKVIKNREIRRTYRHDYINVCTGVVTYSDEQVVTNSFYSTEFIINPNLDRSIRESYNLTSLTRDEAKAAWDNLIDGCNLN